MSTIIELSRELDLNIKSDEPKHSHYAEATSVTEGYVLGTPVMAVCGKLFIPSRDPKKFPICPICKEIAEALFLAEE
jgi:hypothetical protein